MQGLEGESKYRGTIWGGHKAAAAVSEAGQEGTLLADRGPQSPQCGSSLVGMSHSLQLHPGPG